MKPGFVSVITYGNPPTEIPPRDGQHFGTPARAGRVAGLAATIR